MTTVNKYVKISLKGGGETMDVATIVELISNQGFPIACCVALFLYVKYQNDTNRTEMKAQREEHAREVQELTKAVNNNTLVVQHLCDTLAKNEG